MRDFLRPRLHRTHPPTPPSPRRIPRSPPHPPTHLGPINRRTGVGLGPHLHFDFLAESSRLLGRINFREKLRSLVFLHPKIGTPTFSIQRNATTPQDTPGRCREGSRKRTPLIGHDFQTRNLLAVRILETHCPLALLLQFIFFLGVVSRIPDPLEVHRLPRAINRPVSEEHDHPLILLFPNPTTPRIITPYRALKAPARDHQTLPVLHFWKTKIPRLIRLCFFADQFILHPHPRPDRNSRQRCSGHRIHDMTIQATTPPARQGQGERRDMHAHHRHGIILHRKILIRARDQDMITIREVLWSYQGNIVPLELTLINQLMIPCFHRLPLEHRRQPVSLIRQRVPPHRIQTWLEGHRIEAKPNPLQISMRNMYFLSRRSPMGFRRKGQFLPLHPLHFVATKLPEWMVRKGLDPCLINSVSFFGFLL